MRAMYTKRRERIILFLNKISVIKLNDSTFVERIDFGLKKKKLKVQDEVEEKRKKEITKKTGDWRKEGVLEYRFYNNQGEKRKRKEKEKHFKKYEEGTRKWKFPS